MAKRYRVTLRAEERADLERMISRGKADARKLVHARVLLQADATEGGLAWVEIEFSALAHDLPERVGDRPALEQHVTAWQQARNKAEVTAYWRCVAADARIRLRKLYPTIDA